MRDGGKGDRQRPRKIPKEVFDNNWEQIFGKKKTQEEVDQTDSTQDKKSVE